MCLILLKASVGIKCLDLASLRKLFDCNVSDSQKWNRNSYLSRLRDKERKRQSFKIRSTRIIHVKHMLHSTKYQSMGVPTNVELDPVVFSIGIWFFYNTKYILEDKINYYSVTKKLKVWIIISLKLIFWIIYDLLSF